MSSRAHICAAPGAAEKLHNAYLGHDEGLDTEEDEPLSKKTKGPAEPEATATAVAKATQDGDQPITTTGDVNETHPSPSSTTSPAVSSAEPGNGMNGVANAPAKASSATASSATAPVKDYEDLRQERIRDVQRLLQETVGPVTLFQKRPKPLRKPRTKPAVPPTTRGTRSRAAKEAEAVPDDESTSAAAPSLSSGAASAVRVEEGGEPCGKGKAVEQLTATKAGVVSGGVTAQDEPGAASSSSTGARPVPESASSVEAGPVAASAEAQSVAVSTSSTGTHPVAATAGAQSVAASTSSTGTHPVAASASKPGEGEGPDTRSGRGQTVVSSLVRERGDMDKSAEVDKRLSDGKEGAEGDVSGQSTNLGDVPMDTRGTIDSPSLPPWMDDALQYFRFVDGGDGWTQLLEEWQAFEASLGYPDGGVSHSGVFQTKDESLTAL